MRRGKFPPVTIRISIVVLLLWMTALGYSQTAFHSLPTRHVPVVVSNGVAKVLRQATDTKLMRIAIVLPLRNQAQLKSLLKELYDPSSAEYHHFLTPTEFATEFGPSVSDYQATIAWAKAKGFTVGPSYINRLVVPIAGTVAQVDLAFHIEMTAYQDPATMRTFFSPDREPTVDLSVPLWHVAGLSNYSVPRPSASQGQPAEAAVGSGPGGAYLPSDMRAAYYGGTALTGSGQCVGLAEFDGYNISDLTATFDGYASSTTNGNGYSVTYNPPSGGGPFTIPIDNVLVAGGTLTPLASDPSSESEVVLDIAQVIGMAPGLSKVVVYIAPDSFSSPTQDILFPSNDADTTIFNDMASNDACKQLSISWGWQPQTQNLEANDPFFSEMVAQGQTLFAAAGDSGAWAAFGVHNYPEEESDLVAVGGTDLTTDGSGGAWESETAWQDTGGGISPDEVPIPSYQQLISPYYCADCSSTYRNGPDVAMQADFTNYVCSFGSCAGDFGGTSFAAPRWAGFLALVNQQAIDNGMTGGVGFLNNAIYPLAEGESYSCVFHDVTTGGNDAYSATVGFDLATGWGSPNGQQLINALGPPLATTVDQVQFAQDIDFPTLSTTVDGPESGPACGGSVTFSYCGLDGGSCTDLCSAQVDTRGQASCQSETEVNNSPGEEYTLEGAYSGAAGYQSASAPGETVIGLGYGFAPE